MAYYLPLMVVVLSNTLYHISSKSTPESANVFASLSVTYFTGCMGAVLLYLFTHRQPGILEGYRQLNWTAPVLGLAIIGLESGYIWMYRSGWPISSAQVVQAAITAFVLAAVGVLIFKEIITVRKLAGIVICLIGLYLINK